jgi:predicted nucleic acid-binding Zn ribbon protein
MPSGKAAPRVTHGVWGTRWKVEKELQDSPGLAFVRWYLTLFDFSELEQIRLRRSTRRYSSWDGSHPIFGECVSPERTSSGPFRINCNVLSSAPYPARLWDAEEPSSGEPYLLHDENEAVVAIIAHEVSHYLGFRGQIPANGKVDSGGLQSTSEAEANEFMRAAVEAYRRSIGAATSSVDRLPGNLGSPGRSGWCVMCGKPLPKGGGSQFFCTGRCRVTFHNRLRRARLAARRGKMICEVCGAEFTPKQRGAKTCSRACRQKKYRKNRTAHNSS